MYVSMLSGTQKVSFIQAANTKFRKGTGHGKKPDCCAWPSRPSLPEGQKGVLTCIHPWCAAVGGAEVAEVFQSDSMTHVI